MHCVKVFDEGMTNLLKIFKYAQMLQALYKKNSLFEALLLPYLKNEFRLSKTIILCFYILTKDSLLYLTL